MKLFNWYIATSLAAIFLGVSVANAENVPENMNVTNVNIIKDCLSLDNLHTKTDQEHYNLDYLRQAVEIVSKDAISRQRLEAFKDEGGLLCAKRLDTEAMTRSKVHYSFPYLTINNDYGDLAMYATSLLSGLALYDQDTKGGNKPELSHENPTPFRFIEEILDRKSDAATDAVMASYRLWHKTHYIQAFDTFRRGGRDMDIARTLSAVKYNCPTMNDGRLKTILKTSWDGRFIESDYMMAVSRALTENVEESGNAAPLKAWIHKNKSYLHELGIGYFQKEKKALESPIEDTSDLRKLLTQTFTILVNKKRERDDKDMSYRDDQIGTKEKIRLDNWACLNGPDALRPDR